MIGSLAMRHADDDMRQTFLDASRRGDSLDIDAVPAFSTDDIVCEDTTVKHGATRTKQMRRFVQASFDQRPRCPLRLHRPRQHRQ